MLNSKVRKFTGGCTRKEKGTRLRPYESHSDMRIQRQLKRLKKEWSVHCRNFGTALREYILEGYIFILKSVKSI